MFSEAFDSLEDVSYEPMHADSYAAVFQKRKFPSLMRLSSVA